MKRTSQPRAHKALSEAIMYDSAALQNLLDVVPRRMLQRHANGDRPSTRYAYAYEVAFGIPLSAWATKAELKALGKTQRDVDEDFEYLRARRASQTMGVYVDPAEGVPTKPTKPSTLHDVGSIRSAPVTQPGGAVVYMTGWVVEVNEDRRVLRFNNENGTTSDRVYDVADLKVPS